MENIQLTEEQTKDVAERIEKARAALQELHVTFGIMPIYEAIGNGAYITMIKNQLIDTKYLMSKESPIQAEDVKKPIISE